jgi:hypothetical protein
MNMVVALALFLMVDQGNPAGTATIKLTGPDLNISGEYPTTLCGSSYLLGKGMSYQVQAREYRITIASETRSSGAVPLNTPTGMVNVVVTVNGKGKNLIRGPKNSGKLTISEDYRKAEATLELRPVVGTGTSTLVATFNCK